MDKTYNELILLPTFLERFEYLRTACRIGDDTFASARYLNQAFYTSPVWRRVRCDVIIRDQCCDLGIPGYSISGIVHVHHINAITKEDILNNSPKLYDMNNLITVSELTHKKLTYGRMDEDPYVIVERYPGDLTPWKKI